MDTRANRFRNACALFVLAALLAGCTQERALAVKAAAERFAAQAAAAIDAITELHVRGAYGPLQTDEVMLAQARDGVYEVQAADPRQVKAAVAQAFTWVSDREQFRRNAFGEADALKQAYGEFALAFRRLPEGSFVAAGDVACAAGLGARLVGTMATAAQQLAHHPVPLVVETAASQVQVTATAQKAVSANNRLLLDAPLRAHLAVLREQDRANAEVVARLTDAAESGLAVLQMIDKYDQVSAADLAAAVRQVLVIRESSFGLSSQAQLERLDKVVAQIEAEPALAQAAALPLNQKPATCK
jgi:alkylated DNA nucleotide flippase Atl1